MFVDYFVAGEWVGMGPSIPGVPFFPYVAAPVAEAGWAVPAALCWGVVILAAVAVVAAIVYGVYCIFTSEGSGPASPAQTPTGTSTRNGGIIPRLFRGAEVVTGYMARYRTLKAAFRG